MKRSCETYSSSTTGSEENDSKCNTNNEAVTIEIRQGRTIYQNEIFNKVGNRCSPIRVLKNKPSILAMENEWRTYSSIGVQRKILEENTKIIKDFINSLAVPSWYRGVSMFQKKSAELLQNAVRDDCAQRTVHRTMRCLESLGLDPLPTKTQLLTILPLCGGSDLKLLWFLMEWLYRNNESFSYGVNEQLIMSTIAHLDIRTTLRELDRILPPKESIRVDLPQRQRSTSQKRSVRNKKETTKSCLPYFEKLPQPQPRTKGSRYIRMERNRRTMLEYPHEFIDSSHKMANKNHLCDQSYSFEDDERIDDNPTEKKCSRLLKNFEAGTIDENKIHENIDYLKNLLDAEFNVVAKRKAQELEKIFQKNHQSCKRVISRLQWGIEKYRREFHAMTVSFHKLLVKGLYNDQLKTKKSYSNPRCGIQMACSNGEGVEQCKLTNSKSLAQNTTPTEFNSKTSENYFIVSSSFQPFKFDYCEIFDFEENHLKACTEPLKKHSPTEFYGSKDSSNGSSHCSRKILRHNLIEDEVIEISTKENADTDKGELVNGPNYYDPEDDELMDHMLKESLDIMKKDNKFIFASMPAAHRLPMLRKWIRSRYGKTYSREEFSRSFRESMPVFRAVAKVGLPLEMPSNSDMGTDLITDYSCRDYVIRRSNHIRNKFYKRINKAMLAQSRVIYLAMCPFLCCNGSLQNTIFAYMPAHNRVNYHFRPWKLGECMKRKETTLMEVTHPKPKSTIVRSKYNKKSRLK